MNSFWKRALRVNKISNLARTKSIPSMPSWPISVKKILMSLLLNHPKLGRVMRAARTMWRRTESPTSSKYVRSTPMMRSSQMSKLVGLR